jgi:hypothetical protein
MSSPRHSPTLSAQAVCYMVFEDILSSVNIRGLKERPSTCETGLDLSRWKGSVAHHLLPFLRNTSAIYMLSIIINAPQAILQNRRIAYVETPS